MFKPAFEPGKNLAELFICLGSGSAEPRPLSCVPDIQAWAFEPKPRLVPPLAWIKNHLDNILWRRHQIAERLWATFKHGHRSRRRHFRHFNVDDVVPDVIRRRRWHSTNHLVAVGRYNSGFASLNFINCLKLLTYSSMDSHQKLDFNSGIFRSKGQD